MGFLASSSVFVAGGRRPMNKKNAMKCPKLGKTYMSFQFTLCRNSGQIREERASVRCQFLADCVQTAPKRGCQLHAESVDDGRLLSQVGLEIVKEGFNPCIAVPAAPPCMTTGGGDWRPVWRWGGRTDWRESGTSVLARTTQVRVGITSLLLQFVCV